jgi:ppGpp synthetase/RelA/SpoT-type nucleotidyltranferase
MSNSPLLLDFAAQRELYVAFSSAINVIVHDFARECGVQAEISSRAKDLTSLEKKLSKKQHYAALADIPDLAGVRVIVQTLADVRSISDLIAGQVLVCEDVSHDSFGTSGKFGYGSRHLIIQMKEPRAELLEWQRFKGMRCEIQVRTILQHAWASISHSLAYKEEGDVPVVAQRTLSQVAALIEVGDGLFERFRVDVEGLRSQYAKEAGSADDSWRLLAIDLDSLRATWDKWKPSQLIGSPFEDFPRCEVVDRGLVAGEEYPDPQYLSALVASAARRQQKTVGDLADFLRGPSIRQGALNLIKKTSTSSGFGIYTLDFLASVASYESDDIEGRNAPRGTD